jgi:ribosomal protein S18 acetylase RimI-like enzyme
MNIESATTEDIPTLVQYLTELFSIEPDFATNAQTIRQGLELFLGAEPSTEPDRTILVLRDQSYPPRGMISGQLVISTAMGSPSLWIEDVYMSPEYRGQGWGTQLLQAIIQWAKEKGAKRFQLLADQENHNAIEFYHSQGFQTAGLKVLSKKI